MNKVIFSGRLTREPEVRYSQGDDAQAIGRFTLAVDRQFKPKGSEQTADFIPCVVFGKRAEAIEKYVHKGTKLCVCGHMQSGSYTNKDGVKVYTLDCMVEDFEFCEKKQETPQEENSTSIQGNN